MGLFKQYGRVMLAVLGLCVLTACANSDTASTPPSQQDGYSYSMEEAASEETASSQEASLVTEVPLVASSFERSEVQPPTPPISSSVSLEESGYTQTLEIQIGDQSFTGTLTDNSSAAAFCKLLPLTLEMGDLNDNEKFYFLQSSLPTAPYQPTEIHSGDLMLYGSDCLVLFYENFSSSYRYTRLGKIENADDIKDVLGQGNVTITFSLVS